MFVTAVFIAFNEENNLVVNCDIVSWASCAQKRELINLGRRPRWQWRHIFELRHIFVYLFIIRHVTNIRACEQAMKTLDFLSSISEVAWILIINSPFEYDVIEIFVQVHEELSSRTRSLRLWDVNGGKSCT